MNAIEKKKLLVKLESIIGNSCYNGSIQNWGPNYERHHDGREFRYPITFLGDRQDKEKVKTVSPDMPLDKMKTGYYSFEANRLSIMSSLAEIIEYLEENHNLKP